MSALTSLALTDVRCFQGTQEARLPRVALLVGDNSAGKTAFLACHRALAELAGFGTRRDDGENRSLGDDGIESFREDNRFDRPPFKMGAFDTIVRSGAAEFALEGTLSDHCYERVRVVYDRGPHDQPRERELEFAIATDRGDAPVVHLARVDPSADAEKEMWRVRGPGFEFQFEQAMVSYRQFSAWLSAAGRRRQLPYNGDETIWRKQSRSYTAADQKNFSGFFNFFRSRLPFPSEDQLLNVVANDPAGWRRQRWYESNPLGREFDDASVERLRELGRGLGLFDELELRRGRGGTYEIWADASGELHNMVDVGFGVQSVLPLLQAFDRAANGGTLLLQQPESHLHPSVQARLIGLLVEAGGRLLVETHSDHVPKWFLICQQEGKIAAEDLGIVYFERSEDRASSSIFGIGVDADGDLEGAPAGYRKFFMDETLKYLGLDDP